jgi:hypothetical protein
MVIKKIENILRSKRGESIMEAVASFLVLSMLLASVAYMIAISMNWTAGSLLNASEIQEIGNELILGDYENPATLDTFNSTEEHDGDITFSFVIEIDSLKVLEGKAEHQISIAEAHGNIIAFSPAESATFEPPDDDDDDDDDFWEP